MGHSWFVFIAGLLWAGNWAEWLPELGRPVILHDPKRFMTERSDTFRLKTDSGMCSGSLGNTSVLNIAAASLKSMVMKPCGASLGKGGVAGAGTERLREVKGDGGVGSDVGRCGSWPREIPECQRELWAPRGGCDWPEEHRRRRPDGTEDNS